MVDEEGASQGTRGSLVRKKWEVPPSDLHGRVEAAKPYKQSLAPLLSVGGNSNSAQGNMGNRERESTVTASLDDGNRSEEAVNKQATF